MTQLFVLAGEYRSAAQKLADLDLDEQTVADTLESLSGDLEVKATNVAMFARDLEARAEAIKQAEAQTSQNAGMLFNIALNYGGRAEIVEAARRAIASGMDPADLDEQRFGDLLYTAGQPDPDLLIRTSGEMRVSNFLLWQIAYAEIWVTDTLWPDFRKQHLLEAILAYQKRDRRYGGIKQPAVAGR